MEARFKNEKTKGTSMTEEIKLMKMGNNCAVSSAASTRFGLGSGTFARPLPQNVDGRNHRPRWATQNKQGSLSRKTLVSLWFITGTS